MDGKYKLLETGKRKLRRFGVKMVYGLRHTAEKSASLTTSAPSPTPAVHTLLEPPVTFADVAGIDEVRQELEEIVQFLRDPARYDRLGARIPRGALLVGPPGTGKTLLAKAVACEAGVPYFSMSSSEFVEMYVGVGASRVRDLFHKVRCLLFSSDLLVTPFLKRHAPTFYQSIKSREDHMMGYTALGVVISIIGIFLIVAASQHNASKAKGPDGVLQELAHQHQPFGQVWRDVVASSPSAGWPS